MIYLILAVIGFLGPYYFFIQFLAQNGLDLGLMIAQLLANPISTFFALDLLITAIVFLIFSFRTAREEKVPNWWIFLLFTLFIGPSFAFPLFLYARDRRKFA